MSHDYFSVLGLTPRLGRLFLADDDRVPGRDAVVVLSHSYWQRRFDGDPRRVGQTITLNGVPFTVIGVARAGFEGAKISQNFASWNELDGWLRQLEAFRVVA